MKKIEINKGEEAHDNSMQTANESIKCDVINPQTLYRQDNTNLVRKYTDVKHPIDQKEVKLRLKRIRFKRHSIRINEIKPFCLSAVF